MARVSHRRDVRLPIRVGVIGLGRSGWAIHCQALRSDRRYALVAVLDPDRARVLRAGRELHCAALGDLENLLALDLDLVVVASPSHLHVRQAVAVLRAARHVVVEKPMARTAREADLLIAAAHEARCHVFVHQNYVFTREFAFLESLVHSRKLGRVFHIQIVGHEFTRRNDWQTLKRYGGGLLSNHGSQALDMLLRLLGAGPSELLSDMRHISDAGDAEDHVKIFMRAHNGVTGDLELSTSAATTHLGSGWNWTLLGTTGAATVTGGQATLRYYDPAAAPRLRVRTRPETRDRRYGNDDALPWLQEEIPAEGPDPGSFYDSVFETVVHGRPFRVQLQEVRSMLEVMDRCREQNPTFGWAAIDGPHAAET